MALIGTQSVIHLVDHPGGNSLQLKGHRHVIKSIAWQPDGKVLASASLDKTVRFWNTLTGEEEDHIKLELAPFQIAWRPNGEELAIADASNTVRIWSLREQDWIAQSFNLPREITSLSWSPDGTRIASSSNDRNIRIWDTGNFDLVAILRHEDQKLPLVKWSPNGKQLLSIGSKRAVIWDGR